MVIPSYTDKLFQFALSAYGFNKNRSFLVRKPLTSTLIIEPYTIKIRHLKNWHGACIVVFDINAGQIKQRLSVNIQQKDIMQQPKPLIDQFLASQSIVQQRGVNIMYDPPRRVSDQRYLTRPIETNC